jgi:hypothetical protein
MFPPTSIIGQLETTILAGEEGRFDFVGLDTSTLGSEQARDDR